MTKTNNALSTFEWPANALPKRWIESLFERMLFEYGKKFSDQWGGADPEPLKLHWAQRLSDMTGDELKRGVSLLESREWPPSLPEFRKMCRPPMDSIAAYYEAVNGVVARERGEKGEWSHPAIFWASVTVGAFDLKNQPYSQVKERWQKALDDQLAKGEWHEIPEPMVALPPPGNTKTDREQAAKRMAQLQDGAGVKLQEKTDHKAWAKKILERAKQDRHGLSALQIRFAKEALSTAE